MKNTRDNKELNRLLYKDKALGQGCGAKGNALQKVFKQF